MRLKVEVTKRDELSSGHTRRKKRDMPPFRHLEPRPHAGGVRGLFQKEKNPFQKKERKEKEIDLSASSACGGLGVEVTEVRHLRACPAVGGAGR
jgi:hypothetical protein